MEILNDNWMKIRFLINGNNLMYKKFNIYNGKKCLKFMNRIKLNEFNYGVFKNIWWNIYIIVIFILNKMLDFILKCCVVFFFCKYINIYLCILIYVWSFLSCYNLCYLLVFVLVLWLIFLIIIKWYEMWENYFNCFKIKLF